MKKATVNLILSHIVTAKAKSKAPTDRSGRRSFALKIIMPFFSGKIGDELVDAICDGDAARFIKEWKIISTEIVEKLPPNHDDDEPEAAAPKRGPGRPKKQPEPEPEPEPAKRGPGRPKKVAPEPEPAPKRGPGRPKKQPEPEPEPAKRGPGRPKKVVQEEPAPKVRKPAPKSNEDDEDEDEMGSGSSLAQSLIRKLSKKR